MDGEAVELEVRTVCSKNATEDVKASITVQIHRDENDHEVLTIGFPDKKWGMLLSGCSKLSFSTSDPPDVDIEAGVYTNTAMFSPDDNKYDDLITQGRLVKDKDGNNVDVDHSTVVSIYKGSPSGSVKMIEEKNNKDNFTTSERDDNYIRILDKKDLFTYTLEVRNLDDTKSTENLVIIDNLPQPDDATTLRQESKRESEFKVNLAEDPDVQVWLYENADTLNGIADRDKTSPAEYDGIAHTVLVQGTDYTVEYSDKPNNFDEDDWQGNDTGDRWYTAPTPSTRSIRIHFNRKIEKNQAVQIRFDAQIDASDENAKPGNIAWNTFGYSYGIDGLVAKASPNKVGICIPGCPTISKKVVNSKGEASSVPEDTTFEFIIYKGDTVEFEDYTAKTVAETLKDKDVDFMYTALEVKAGGSRSEELTLEKFLKFDYTAGGEFVKTSEESLWETDLTYHIVEFDNNKNYRYSSTNKADENNYSFKLDPVRNTSLSVENENMVTPPVELPSSGGKGTRMFVLGGLMMIFLSAFILVRDKRKHTKS